MAEPTGLEPATSDVTGRRSNQLNYDPDTAITMLVMCGLTNCHYRCVWSAFAPRHLTALRRDTISPELFAKSWAVQGSNL